MNKALRLKHYPSELTKAWNAKNKDFSFVPGEDVWQLGVGKTNTFEMGFLHDQALPLDVVVFLVSCMAQRASSCSTGSIHSGRSSVAAWLRNLNTQTLKPDLVPQCINAFRALRLGYQEHFKKIFQKQNTDEYRTLLTTAWMRDFVTQLDHISRDYTKQTTDQKRSKTIIDPVKGVHTQTELDSIFEAIRLYDQHVQTLLAKPGLEAKDIFAISNHLAFVLMFAIIRRPTQLRALKLGDLRRRGQSFHEEIMQIPELVDQDELLLRIFKGKDSAPFRGDAERFPQLLIAELASTLNRYVQRYAALFINNQCQNGITLRMQERHDLLQRLPLFPAYDVLTTAYPDKATLFSVFDMKTETGHLSSCGIVTNLRNYRLDNLSANFKSERLADPALMTTGNNRIRHTVLTNAALNGSTVEEIAAITGVVTDTVAIYIDFSLRARQQINSAFEDNDLINLFATNTIHDVLQRPEFAVRNAYGDTFGELEEHRYCGGCKKELPKPLGCYGCNNFHPLADADHRSELTKAEQKYAINLKQGQPERSLRPLKLAIREIKAVIVECDQRHKALTTSAESTAEVSNAQ